MMSLDSLILLATAWMAGFSVAHSPSVSSTNTLAFIEQRLYTNARAILTPEEANTFHHMMIVPIVKIVEASLAGADVQDSEEKQLKLKVLLHDAEELRLLILAEYANPELVVKTSRRYKPTPYLLGEVKAQYEERVKLKEQERDALDAKWRNVINNF